MSLINKEIGEFSVQAYHNEAFKEVKKEMCWEDGAFSSFIRRTLLLCARRNWRISRANTRNSRRQDAKSTLCPAIPTMSTRRGMTLLNGSKRSDIHAGGSNTCDLKRF